MDAYELSSLTAEPIQTLGMSYYFDPGTSARAKELGLNVFEFYGLGRGGVLGNVDAAAIDAAFVFFQPSLYDALWDQPRLKADPVATAAAYAQAANEFADRTFGAVPTNTLTKFAEGARRVATMAPKGRCALVEGYLRQPEPASPVHAAYLGTILLRELRGGLHIHAVHDAGMTPAEACYLSDATIFKLHGYTDDDVPTVTPELEEKKKMAEVLTSASMATCFEVLNESERQQLADGTRALVDALSDPAPVQS